MLVKIEKKELERLRRKEAELEDYYQTSKVMRQKQLEHLGFAHSPYSQGWLACLSDWSLTLVSVQQARMIEEEAEAKFLRPIWAASYSGVPGSGAPFARRISDHLVIPEPRRFLGLLAEARFRAELAATKPLHMEVHFLGKVWHVAAESIDINEVRDTTSRNANGWVERHDLGTSTWTVTARGAMVALEDDVRS